MPVFVFTVETGETASWEITPLLDSSLHGVENKYALALSMLHYLESCVGGLNNQVASVRARAYQRFHQLPVCKDKGKGDYNPGTDTFFKDVWLPADSEYQRVLENRDRVRAMLDNLKFVYIPQIKAAYERITYAERQSVHQVQQPGRF